jgi:hypothetical protein
LSYPRLEKLAYMQFSALFENGSIVLRKQLLPVFPMTKSDHKINFNDKFK